MGEVLKQCTKQYNHLKYVSHILHWICIVIFINIFLETLQEGLECTIGCQEDTSVFTALINHSKSCWLHYFVGHPSLSGLDQSFSKMQFSGCNWSRDQGCQCHSQWGKAENMLGVFTTNKQPICLQSFTLFLPPQLQQNTAQPSELNLRTSSLGRSQNTQPDNCQNHSNLVNCTQVQGAHCRDARTKSEIYNWMSPRIS